jgi:cell division protease FtsH
MSDATAKLIDEEIRRVVEAGEQKAREILRSHLDELHAIAKGLLEFETLSADEIRRIIRGEKIVRDTGGPAEEPARPTSPGRRSTVPPTGKTAGGFEPEPQPGG